MRAEQNVDQVREASLQWGRGTVHGGWGMYKEEEGAYVWKGGFPNLGALDGKTRARVVL